MNLRTRSDSGSVMGMGEASTNEAQALFDGLKAKGWNPSAFAAHDYEVDSAMLSMGWAPPSAEWLKRIDDACADERKTCAVKSQAFFAALALSVRPGHVGDAHRTSVNTVLAMAEAAGLYVKETE